MGVAVNALGMEQASGPARSSASCVALQGREVSADVAAAFWSSLKTLETLGAELEEMPPASQAPSSGLNREA
jgi:hypothetical protein